MLPNSSDSTINTTYSTGMLAEAEVERMDRFLTSIVTIVGKDHSAAVGGAVGGVLGAALIASLFALCLTVRSRKVLRSDLGNLQQEHQNTLHQDANEKAALQHQLSEQQMQYQQYQQQMQAPVYSPQSHYNGYAPSSALATGVHSPHHYTPEMSSAARPVEMDSMRGASELSDETATQKTFSPFSTKGPEVGETVKSDLL